MRHNQNARHMRGRRNNSGGGGNNNHHHQRRGGGNPRVQTFDSNGPDVRIRGNAFQINEKYLALARDAASAGDRVLAESYLQHAEHYQRMINDMVGDDTSRPGHQQQNNHFGEGPQPSVDDEQPSAEGMDDLDQGFLVSGGRNNGAGGQQGDSGDEDQSSSQRTRQQQQQKEVAGAV